MVLCYKKKAPRWGPCGVVTELLLSSTMTVRAFCWTSEEVMNLTGSIAFRASWSRTEAVSKNAAARGCCADVTCAFVAQAVVEIIQTSTVFASVKCHIRHLLKVLDGFADSSYDLLPDGCLEAYVMHYSIAIEICQ